METTDSGDQKSTNEGSIFSNNYSHRLSPECQTLGKAQEKITAKVTQHVDQNNKGAASTGKGWSRKLTQDVNISKASEPGHQRAGP